MCACARARACLQVRESAFLLFFLLCDNPVIWRRKNGQKGATVQVCVCACVRACVRACLRVCACVVKATHQLNSCVTHILTLESSSIHTWSFPGFEFVGFLFERLFQADDV